MSDILNVFSVDVEDYFQVSAFDNCVRREEWDDYPSRVVGNTQRILHLLEQCQVRATFFVLGWVARRFPHLVKEIHRGGHEIASHGFWHRLVYDQTPDEFREDVRTSRDTLQHITGTPVVAYRAPSFSIIKRSLWALEILVEEGFSIDSSIFPIHHDRYGTPGAESHIRQVDTAAGPLREVPPSVTKIARLNIPIGGGYFRLYPWPFTHSCLRRINQQTRQPFMFYVHPWELDPLQPRVQVGSRRSRMRHYLNLHKTEPRLQKLLSSFRLGTLTDSLQHLQASIAGQPAAELSRAS